MYRKLVFITDGGRFFCCLPTTYIPMTTILLFTITITVTRCKTLVVANNNNNYYYYYYDLGA